MPFRRRSPAGWAEKIRNAAWPRKGVTRNVRYYGLRAARISASPYAVAAGIADGVMIGWTPFLGFHIPLAIALAFLLRGSLVAAALGTLPAAPAKAVRPRAAGGAAHRVFSEHPLRSTTPPGEF